jgi:hypothetical protein
MVAKNDIVLENLFKNVSFQPMASFKKKTL